MYLLIIACLIVQDQDADGYTSEEGDCNDTDASVHPLASDPIGDAGQVDQNCDGVDGMNYCSYEDRGWIEVLDVDDPSGDAGDYMFDIRSYQYQLRELEEGKQTLYLRTTSHVDFSEDELGFQIDMHIDNDTVGYNVSYDTVYAVPEKVQLWSSLNEWEGPLNDATLSLFYCPDTEDALVLGASLLELGFEQQTWVYGYTSVGYWNKNDQGKWDTEVSPKYDDKGPDDPLRDGGIICLQEVPHVTIERSYRLEEVEGNGDGLISPGERFALHLPANVDCASTAPGLRARGDDGVFNQADLTYIVQEVEYNNGESLTRNSRQVEPNGPVIFEVAPESLTGSDVLVITITTYDSTYVADGVDPTGYHEDVSLAFDVVPLE